MRTGRSIRLLSCVVLGLGGCVGDDDHGNQPADANPDSSIDGSACGAESMFAGTLIDWKATSATFCGVNAAKATVRGDTARTKTTAPNGRLELCLARKDLTLIDVVPSATASACTTPSSPYPDSAVIVVQQALLDAGGTPSARMMTADTKGKTFGTGTLGAYNAGQAQVVVHLDGAARAVTIGNQNHSVPLQFNGTLWGESTIPDSATGNDVYFPNVDASAPVTISVQGVTSAITLSQAAGTLEPGKFTYLTFLTK